MLKKQFLALTAILVLSGCAQNRVDYIDGETAVTTETSVEPSKESNMWREKLKVKDKSGETISVNINVLFDENMTMPKMKLQKFKLKKNMSAEERKKLLTGLFDDGIVYNFDVDSVPRDYLISEKEFYEGMLDQLDKEGKELYTALIEKLEASIAKAPTDLILADDFSSSRYMGNINGVPHVIGISFMEDVVKKILENPESYEATQHPIIIYPYTTSFEENSDTNMNEKDGKELADILMERLYPDGVNYLGYDNTSYNYVQGQPDMKPYLTEKFIYLLTTEDFEVETSKGVMEKYTARYSFNDIQMFIDEYGHINAITGSNYELGDIEEDVPLLSLKDVKELLINEINEGLSSKDVGTQINYDKLELGYTEVLYGDSDGAIVPCWKLSPDFTYGYGAIYINAIDGSVIKYQKN